ncbi:hypothetical protein D3C75_1164460 [compost metagenome]
MALSMAIMAITTISSIRVKPRCVSICCCLRVNVEAKVSVQDVGFERVMVVFGRSSTAIYPHCRGKKKDGASFAILTRKYLPDGQGGRDDGVYLKRIDRSSAVTCLVRAPTEM